MKLAFYAPMKSPDHPVPSGDRRMGRLLWTALEQAGFAMELASDLRSFDGNGNPDFQTSVKRQGEAEAERLIRKWREAPDTAPDGWFTYHLYHKAPDWIGPAVCGALQIPYFVAEASHAPKRAEGDWQMGYEAAATAIGSARIVFHMTALDGACLESLVSAENKLILLPPFLDIERFREQAIAVDIDGALVKAGGQKDAKTLLAVAMMRGGDKMISYQQLGRALSLVTEASWQLLIIGDGERRRDVEAALAPIGNRVVYLGVMTPEELPAWYEFADIYTWPAHGEAYGMAFLEAEGCGLPVVAGDIRGVPDVVRKGETGILTAEGEAPAFARAVDELLQNDELRLSMGKRAREFVETERTLSAAADTLKKAIEEAM